MAEGTNIVCSPAFAKKHDNPDTIEALSQLDWVIYTPSSPTLTLSKDGVSHRIRLKGPVKTNNSAARLSFVLAGQGVAKLPHWAVKPHLDSGELVELLPDCETQDIDIYAVFPRRLNGANQIRMLVDFIKEYLNDPANTPS